MSSSLRQASTVDCGGVGLAMAVGLSPWVGRGGCGRRGNARPLLFSFGSPAALFSDLVIVKVPKVPTCEPAAMAHMANNARVVQWAQTSQGHTFELRFPGLKKEDLQIQVEDDRTLYIKYSNEPKQPVMESDAAAATTSGSDAQAQAQKPTKSGSRLTNCSFMRKLKLPETADLEHITAEVANQTLTVTVPKLNKKAPTSQPPRPINISDDAAATTAASSSQEELGKAVEKAVA